MPKEEMLQRTDLATELHELNVEKGVDDGIVTKDEEISGFFCTTVEIKPGKGEDLSGKLAGIYITIDIGRIWEYESSSFNAAAKVVADKLSGLLPKDENRSVLVVGLGNENVTADAIGPRVASGLIISHHIKELKRTLYDSIGFGDVSALAPGVLGQTGIESAEIVKSVTATVKPDCVIVIDALASRRLERLATTVQLSDKGISPGSGVNNSRQRLDEDTLGVPVISIGMPTVVDAVTLVYDLIEEVNRSQEQKIKIDAELLSRTLTENRRNFFITPKETDTIIKASAKLLSTALNMALHPKLPPEEIPEYL